MPRFKLTIEYDGSSYLGWQMQPLSAGPSLQGVLARAAHAFSGESVVVHGAGRTDAGVHALGQVAHVTFTRDWRPDVVRDAMNARLRPDPIAIVRAETVPDTFDARFSATRRHYLFRILNRRAPPSLDIRRVWWVPRPLDLDAMREGAARLIGRHDFTTFRSTQCQANSPVRTLETFDLQRAGDEIHCRLSARSFLHNQVRSMVGSLRLLGDGSWTPDDISAALEARDRKACGTVAPPDGLYLAAVDY